MKTHFTPPVIVFNEGKNFYAATMVDGERVATWYARVKKLSLDRIIMDKFIIDLPNKIFENCEMR